MSDDYNIYDEQLDPRYDKLVSFVDFALQSLKVTSFIDNRLTTTNKDTFDEGVRLTMEYLKSKNQIYSYSIDSVLKDKALSVKVRMQPSENSKHIVREYKMLEYPFNIL